MKYPLPSVKTAALVVWVLLLVPTSSAGESAANDHAPSLLGLEIGMTAQDVLDRLGRMPDDRKDEDNQIIVFWKQENGDVLQVNFLEDHVCHLGLKYAAARPSGELWLRPLKTQGAEHYGGLQTGTILDGRDPRFRAEYKPTQTKDKLRTVWTREIKAEEGYRVEVQFLSSSQQERGERYEEFVDFKYVTVPKKDHKKFVEVMRARSAS